MNYFLDSHLLLIDHMVQIFKYQLAQFHNLTTVDHVKWRNDKTNACKNTRLTKLVKIGFDKEILKGKLSLIWYQTNESKQQTTLV